VNSERNPLYRPEYRVRHLVPVLAILFGFFGYRLYSLQILQQGRFKSQARQNYIRSIRVPALRGRIYDRENRLLADNVARYDLTLNSRHCSRRGIESSFAALGEILGASPGELRDWWRNSPRDRNGARTVLRDIGYRTVVQIEERLAVLPGVEVIQRPRRWTIHDEVGAHILGYTGEISSAELERPGFAGYQMGSEVGRAGVERTMERYLHGSAGERKVRVFANGLIERDVLGEGAPAEPGKDVILTIDWDLQAAAQAILGSSPGAIVAMDPRNGDVLTLVSWPTYDPNLFSSRSPGRTEILNRTVGRVSRLVNVGLEAYPPGSVFKVPLALAALDSRPQLRATSYQCSGVYWLGDSSWRCWRRGGHGKIDIVEALQHSCDCFFYNLGRQLGVEFMDEATKQFGFGELTGIELPAEKRGFRPSPESKREAVVQFRSSIDPNWYPGDTINSSIGQGVVLATPLQVTCMMAMVANGGTLWKPRLVKQIRTRNGEVVEEFAPRARLHRQFRRDALVTVIEGLYQAVNEPGGTAYQQRIPGLSVCGKTATAQNEDPQHDHAWFSCFAPRENPEVVVTVLLLWGGHGGSAAAPKARAILELYLGDSESDSFTFLIPDVPHGIES
jgi:penicillin-binding protein 2